MANYYLSGGSSETGDRILLSVGWEHKKSELRALCVVDSKGFQDSKLLNASFISGSDGHYSIDYPFSQAGLPWKAYLWRETTENSTVKYESGRIPVEAILTKLTELSRKSDEVKVALERALMTPEDMDGKMFIPPVNVRKGEVLGFDKDGNVVTGEACEQIRELFGLKPTLEELLLRAQELVLEARNQADIAGTHSADAAESVSECVELTRQTQSLRDEAEGILQKVNEAGTAFSHDASISAGKAQQSAEDAEASALRAEEATNTVIGGLKDLDKKLCYVGCAVKRVENADKNVIQSTEAAEMSATSAGQSAMTAQQMATVATSKAKEAEEYAAQLSRVYKYCGTVATQAELPTSGNTLGDVWNVADTGQNYAWDGTAWDALGGTMNYATTEEFEALQSAVVHKSGNETITGKKTFRGVIWLSDNGSFIGDPGYGMEIVKNSGGKINIKAHNIDLGVNYGDGSLSVLPLGTTTALGAPAYGLHVSATGGLQLFGTHFLNGDIWTDDSVKMVKGNVSLTSTDTASIGFDYANEVTFRTMPNDGTEATYKLEAWQWDDDSHTTKSPSAGVKLLKPSQKSALEATSVLNMEEGDARWWRAGSGSIPIKPGGQSLPASIMLTGNSGERFTLSFVGIEKNEIPYFVSFALPFTGGQIALLDDIPDVSGYLSTTDVEHGNLAVGTVLSVGNNSSYAPFYVNIYPYDSSLAIEFPMQSGRALIPYKDGDNTVAFTSDVSAVDLTKGGTINGELVVESNNPVSIEANGEIQACSGNFSYLYVSGTATIENVGNYEASIPNIKYLNENFSRRDNTILGSGASGTVASNPVGVAIGENAKATGGGKTAEATAVGARASATGACSTAIGRDTTASDCMTVALGADASATKNNSTALGAQSSASNEYSTAVGDGAKALGFASTAVGSNVENFLDSSALVGAANPSTGTALSIGVINDDNPGFLFVEKNENGDTLTGVRISKENFMAMLKQFGGEDFTATKPAEEQATE